MFTSFLITFFPSLFRLAAMVGVKQSHDFSEDDGAYTAKIAHLTKGVLPSLPRYSPSIFSLSPLPPISLASNSIAAIGDRGGQRVTNASPPPPTLTALEPQSTQITSWTTEGYFFSFPHFIFSFLFVLMLFLSFYFICFFLLLLLFS